LVAEGFAKWLLMLDGKGRSVELKEPSLMPGFYCVRRARRVARKRN